MGGTLEAAWRAGRYNLGAASKRCQLAKTLDVGCRTDKRRDTVMFFRSGNASDTRVSHKCVGEAQVKGRSYLRYLRYILPRRQRTEQFILYLCYDNQRAIQDHKKPHAV